MHSARTGFGETERKQEEPCLWGKPKHYCELWGGGALVGGCKGSQQTLICSERQAKSWGVGAEGGALVILKGEHNSGEGALLKQGA